MRFSPQTILMEFTCVIAKSWKGAMVIHRHPSCQSYKTYTMMAEDGEYTKTERGMAIVLFWAWVWCSVWLGSCWVCKIVSRSQPRSQALPALERKITRKEESLAKFYHTRNVIGRENLIACGRTNEFAHAFPSCKWWKAGRGLGMRLSRSYKFWERGKKRWYAIDRRSIVTGTRWTALKG